MIEIRYGYWVRKCHRWLGLLIGVQLLLWTISGLYFSLMPIDQVRGEDRVRAHQQANYALTPMVSPAIPIDALLRRYGQSVQVNAVSLGEVLGEMVFEIHYAVGGASKVVLATASNGELRVPLTRTQALQLAQQDFSLPIAASSVDYIEAVASDDEYRGYPLPAWRVSFADDRNSRIYISAELARVTARRNDVWRIFDLMWALHILDFEQRENFNTLLLQTLAWLGVVTIISGFVLWLMTTSLFRSRR